VARPVADFDARTLWIQAQQAAAWKANDYGVIGNDVVCSERVGIAVARATESEHLRRSYLPVETFYRATFLSIGTTTTQSSGSTTD
jgi:hypothetical protein